MRYLAMIYSDEATDPTAGSSAQTEMSEGYRVFGEEAGRRGALLGGERLRPCAEAKTVRIRDGKTLVSDGPFAEAREQLGGYYVLNCGSEAEAIELAALIPGAKNGSIEVRPIWEME
jgi:hypothetical protein